jgi:hypothetical protein
MVSPVLAVDATFGASLVQRYLDEHPQLGPALVRAGARIVVFEVAFQFDPVLFHPVARQGLERALAAVPADIRPLFVAVVHLSDLRDPSPGSTRWLAPPALSCTRGVFLGYIGLGEGGVLFVGPDGTTGAPTPDAVLAQL